MAAVARVGDAPIDGRDLALRCLRQYSPHRGDWAPVVRRVLDQRIDILLLAAEAKRRGLKLSDQAQESLTASTRAGWPKGARRRLMTRLGVSERAVQAWAAERRLADHLIANEIGRLPELDVAAVEAWLADHPGEPRVEVRHLVNSDKRQVEEARRQHLRGTPFAQLAARYGQAPEAGAGGLLPAFAKGQMPALFNLAFQLKIGELSEPLRSEHGWHLIRLERKIAAPDGGRERARLALLREREANAQKSLLQSLRRATSIRVDEGALRAVASLLHRTEPNR
jgi:parvulin-like peptidyl-prolyl isomerase